jgi:hypothetical protein
MTDLSNTILAKSNQLTADDLMGKTITIKITKVSGQEGEQPIMINYENDGGKPYYPGKSMRRVLANVWGLNGNAYVGRSLTLYRDDKVKFGGLEVGGIRISHMSHMTAPVTMALTQSKANKKPFTVKPLAAPTPAAAPPPEPTDDDYVELKAVGTEAASQGTAAYIKWKDALTPEQKERIKPLHSGFAKTAKAFDDSQPKEEGPGL